MRTTRMTQKAFGDDAMSASQTKVWHKCFKDGWESVANDLCGGRTATSRTPENVKHVWAATNKDQQLTGREREADLGISKTPSSETLTQDLGMKQVVAKFALGLLLPEQKECCAAVANDLTQTTTNIQGLAPCDFWLFPKLKSPLKRKRFQTVNEIQKNMTGQLMAYGELCEVPGCIIWRGLRHHCPMYNVSGILYLLQ